VDEGEWNTEPVVPATHQLGAGALGGGGGLEMAIEMAATPRPPSSPPSPRSTDPGVSGVSGYAAPPLDAE